MRDISALVFAHNRLVATASTIQQDIALLDWEGEDVVAGKCSICHSLDALQELM
jgi:hypothetical protein